jgi:colanic acid biosynthesis glycosyl transferase WcaI
MFEAPPRLPRVVFVNRFYWPDEPATAQLLTDLAAGLAARGHEVVVVTRHPGHTSVPRRETRDGVTILRVSTSRLPRFGLPGKALDFATFFFGAFFRLLRTLRKNDAVVALTDPPLLGVGVWLAARLRRARLFHWVQDIFPELAMELAGQTWLRGFRPLRNAAWRGAECITTLGTDMTKVLLTAGVSAEKISIIPNWAPAGLSVQPAEAAMALRNEWKLEGKFVVAYSGNFGRVHDLMPVLEVAEKLQNDPGVVFLMIGGGAQRDLLEQETARRALTNVVFKSPQPRSRLAESLAVGDVHLVTLRAGCERYVFPSKLYGIAAVGRPTIFIGPRDSHIAREISDGGFGFAFAAKDVEGVAASIRALQVDLSARTRLGEAAATFAKKQGGIAKAVERWHTLLTAPSAGLAAASVRS